MLVQGDPESTVRTNLEPYDKNLMRSKEFAKAVQMRRSMEARHAGFDNLIRDPPRKGLFGQPGMNTLSMDHYLYPQTQKLCRGDVVSCSVFLSVVALLNKT